MKIIPEINPMTIIMHLNPPIKPATLFILGCFVFLLILLLLFVYYTPNLRETFTGKWNPNTTFFYIPDLTDISYQVLTADMSSVSLDISKIKNQEKISINDAIKETTDMISFYQTMTSGLQMTEDYQKKYDLEVVNTDLYKKIQKIKENNVATLDREFSRYFSQVEEKTVREFNEKIKPYNYLMNVVSLHSSLDGSQTIGSKDSMRRYFLKKMAEYRGNVGQLADLKKEFYDIIAPGYYMRTIFSEYLDNLQFYQNQYDIPLLLNTVKEELMKVRENNRDVGDREQPWGVNTPLILALYQYSDICYSFWHFLSKCDETKRNISLFFMKYREHTNQQPSILLKIFN